MTSVASELIRFNKQILGPKNFLTSKLVGNAFRKVFWVI